MCLIISKIKRSAGFTHDTYRYRQSLHGSNGDMKLDVNLTIKEGDFIALSGESGSGKTTLLRILAGLEEARGTLKIGNEIWQDGDFSLAPQKERHRFCFSRLCALSQYDCRRKFTFCQ